LKKLLWDRTSGRPLFIEALLRELLQDGYIDQAEGYAELKADADMETMPDDVRELVISRLDSFSPDEQQVLRAASALVEEFFFKALQAVAEIDDDDKLRGILDTLSEAQMLESVSADVYRFRHGLTQRVIYESLARVERLKLHRLAARFWRAHREISYQPIVLAFHLVKSGLLPEAIEVVTTAAEEAEQNGDLDRAVELYTHALGIFPDEHSIGTELIRLHRLQQER
jgi:predicted ATPase